MIAIVPQLLCEFRETFLHAASVGGLDRGIEAVALAGAAFLGGSRKPFVLLQLMGYVSERYGVSIHLLMNGGRHEGIAHPRQVCMWVLQRMGFSYPTIGSMLGGKHHTTVMHGVRAVDKDPARLAVGLEILASMGEKAGDSATH